MAKNPPEMQETQVPSPGWEDSLEKGMATLFRDLPCSSDGKESVCNAGDPSSIPGSGRSWRREWQPTPVFLPEKFHGLREEPGWLQSMGSQRVGHD